MEPVAPTTCTGTDRSLRVYLDSLGVFQPHGWPDPGLVLKPPFDPADITLPPGWDWGCLCLGDLIDAIDARAPHLEEPMSAASGAPLHPHD